jgi:hypothetical protein
MRGDAATFSLRRRWSRAGRPWGRREAVRQWQLACSALVREEEEGGQLGWVGQKAEWADWLLSQLGRKLGEIPFRNKIGFLNLQRL